jgi:RNA polymerase sigma-70 factor (ECF subfamily)
VILPVEQGAESLEQLAEQAQAGCLVSFEKIVEQNKNRLFTYLLQLIGNAEDAEDVAQETFIKAYRHLHSFDGRARFSTWLYAIAKNTAFSCLRRRKPNQPIEGLEEVLPAPEQRVDFDQVDSIWTIARTLKPNLFEILWLFYGEGFSLNEVAQITGGNAVTVRVNLHRARAALAKKCKLEKFQ